MKLASRILNVTTLAIIACLLFLPALSADITPISNSSKILVLGSGATTYKTTLQTVCTQNNLSPTIVAFSAQVLNSYYSSRFLPTDKNSLLRELDKDYDYIIYIPSEDYVKNKAPLLMTEVKLLQRYTRNMGSQILLPVIWNSTNTASLTPTFENITYRVADAWKIDCNPAGLIWKDVLNDTANTGAKTCSISAPNTHAAFTMAVSLYKHLTGNSPALPSTSVNYGTSPTTAQQQNIINKTSALWPTLTSPATAHYSGTYAGNCFTPWTTTADLQNRSWVTMGTSSESKTRQQMNRIVEALYGTSKSVHMNGYDYGTTYFPANIINYPAAAQIVTNNDFEWAFGRNEAVGGGYVYNYAEGMTKLDQANSLNANSHRDTKFIMNMRHLSNSPSGTVAGTETASSTMMQTVLTASRIHAIPNHIGIAWAWEDRPDIILVPTDNQHMSEEGYLLQASMLYTLLTGQNASAIPGNWTESEMYVLRLGYQIVNECGRLKTNTPPTATNTTHTLTQDTYSALSFAGTDPDNDYLTYTVTSQPTNGSVKLVNGQYIYTPNKGFSGTDTVGFQAFDGSDHSTNEATLTITVTAPAPQKLVWERGLIRSVNNATWQTVTLRNTYTNMVVIATPAYVKTARPAVTRITNVTSKSFDILAQTTDTLTGSQNIDVEYLVVEAGTYTPETHGIKLEAQTYTSTVTDRTGSWKGELRTYANTYSNPVVLGQVMSYNDSRYSYFWSHGKTSALAPSGTADINGPFLYTGKAIGEDTVTTRANETIGYIVLEAGSGTIGDGIQYQAGLGRTSVLGMGDNPGYSYTITPVGLPLAAAATNSAMKDTDGAWTVLYGSSYLTNSTLSLAVDEDNILDPERGSYRLKADGTTTALPTHAAYIVFSMSPDIRLYLPGAPDADTDNNGMVDLAQFAAGGDFQGNAMNSVYSIKTSTITAGTRMDLNLYQRKNLATFNVTQKVMLSIDLVNWYDVEAAGFPYTDITLNKSVLQNLTTNAIPSGDVQQLRYRLTIPTTYPKAFLRVQTQQN